MKSAIQSLEASYLVHHTENGPRISEAVERTLGPGWEKEEEELEGHFGNRITRVSYRFTGEGAEAALLGLAAGLPMEARKQLLGELPSLLDEHSALFLRFDKQAMVRDRLKVGGEDPIRIKVKPRLFAVKGTPVEMFARLIAGSG